MREIGYSGYIGHELCHPLPVFDGQTVGLEFAEKNARLACRYMRTRVSTMSRPGISRTAGPRRIPGSRRYSTRATSRSRAVPLSV